MSYGYFPSQCCITIANRIPYNDVPPKREEATKKESVSSDKRVAFSMLDAYIVSHVIFSSFRLFFVYFAVPFNDKT